VRYADLPTEQANPRSRGLDLLTTKELVRVMHEADRRVHEAVEAALPEIAAVADLAAEALGRGGRLIYAGAGTSGRLGVLDAAECPPTFGTEPGQVVGIIAGGPGAVFRAREGAEDDGDAGEAAIAELATGEGDLVVGITSSGVTPWVRGALEEAGRRGASTALVTCGDLEDLEIDARVVLATGPEVLAGSTRMKAGTATKLALNMISTAAMVRIGKVYDNLMVDLRAGSAKLRDRALRLVTALTDLAPDEAEPRLAAADGEVKTAVVAERLSVTPARARELLAASGGHLRPVLEGRGP
jgi:N-acetylmuramic acid 6-phosphate etherase